MISRDIWSNNKSNSLKIRDTRSNLICIVKCVDNIWRAALTVDSAPINESYSYWELLSIHKPIKTILPLPG